MSSSDCAEAMRNRMKALTWWTNIAVAVWVIPKLIFA